MTCPIDHLEAQLTAYQGISRQIADLNAARERLRQAIVDALGSNEAGTIGDKVAVRYTRYVSRRLSPDLVRKRFTEDELADCYTETSGTRFTVLT